MSKPEKRQVVRTVKDRRTGDKKQVAGIVWRARYKDDTGKEHVTHHKLERDAQRWLDEVTTSVVSGLYVDPRAGKITFAKYAEEWSARQVWESGTVRAVRVAIASVTFLDVPLATVRRSHVEQWVKGMSTAGLAASTIHTRFINVHSVLRAAHRDKVIATDPGENIALPRRRRAENAMRIPTSEQVGQLLGATDSSFRTFLGLGAFAGLRLGELSAVQVGDIDFLRRQLQVTRQVQHVCKGLVELRPPKYGSERTVFLPDDLLAMLASQVAALEESADGDKRWLFPGQGIHPVHPSSIKQRWQKACASGGIQGFTLHDLRHYFASGLIAAGCDVVTVQRALGHSNATTTLNTYSHLWPKAEDRTRRASEAMMSDATAAGSDCIRTGS